MLDSVENGSIPWYAIRVHGGYEDKIRLSIHDAFAKAGFVDAITDVVLVSEPVVVIVSGKKKQKNRNLSYLFLQIPDLNNYVKDILSNVDGVYGFVGVSGWGKSQVPVAIPYVEIERMLRKVGKESSGDSLSEAVYEEGDVVEVIDGAFQGTSATIKRIFPARRKVEVLVRMFSSFTPMEFNYSQVKKSSLS
jgi:transcriptional antiterminator NusG